MIPSLKFNKIMVREIKEEKTPGGIIMPVLQDFKSQSYGVVIAVGPGRTTEYGVTIPVCVKPGDKVTISMNVTAKIKVDGVEYWVVPDSEVICVHDPEPELTTPAMILLNESKEETCQK
jgi:chaperonin GroES